MATLKCDATVKKPLVLYSWLKLSTLQTNVYNIAGKIPTVITSCVACSTPHVLKCGYHDQQFSNVGACSDKRWEKTLLFGVYGSHLLCSTTFV